MRDFGVAVVGAGIAGASLAYRLAGERSVLLLERESQPGYHATGRSAAMFMESYGPPAMRALTRASRTFYEQAPDGFGDLPLLTPRGVLYLATHGQEALLQETQRVLAASGCELDRLDAGAALACVGCLRPEVVHGALFEHGAQDLDVHALHQGFLRGMRMRGGELRTGAQVVAAQRHGVVAAPRRWRGGARARRGRCRRCLGRRGGGAVRRRADRAGAAPAQRIHVQGA